MFRTTASVGAIILATSLAASAQPNTPPSLSVSSFTESGTVDVRKCLPPPAQGKYKLIGGGASVEGGKALISSYPDGERCWHATAESGGTLKVWAIALLDPTDQWDVFSSYNRVVRNSATFPRVTKSWETAGYTLTGGGARVEGSGTLVATWPTSLDSWEAVGTTTSDAVTAYMLGIKPKVAWAGLKAKIFSKSGTTTATAKVEDNGPEKFTLTGGGGRITSGTSSLSKAHPSSESVPKEWEVTATGTGSVEARVVGVTIGVR